jgi:hypothetical protein
MCHLYFLSNEMRVTMPPDANGKGSDAQDG